MKLVLHITVSDRKLVVQHVQAHLPVVGLPRNHDQILVDSDDAGGEIVKVLGDIDVKLFQRIKR